MSAPTPRLMFVCTGNICRSPFAAAAAVAQGVPSPRVGSCGTWARTGTACPSAAVNCARTFGIDLSDHRATVCAATHDEPPAWLVCMEFDHLAWALQHLRTNTGSKALLLGEFLPRSGVEIPDPYGGPPEVYLRVYRNIWQAVEGLVADWRGVIEGRQGNLP